MTKERIERAKKATETRNRNAAEKLQAHYDAGYREGYRRGQDEAQTRLNKDPETLAVRRNALAALTEMARQQASLAESLARALMSERNQL